MPASPESPKPFLVPGETAIGLTHSIYVQPTQESLKFDRFVNAVELRNYMWASQSNSSNHVLTVNCSRKTSFRLHHSLTPTALGLLLHYGLDQRASDEVRTLNESYQKAEATQKAEKLSRQAEIDRNLRDTANFTRAGIKSELLRAVSARFR
jgi:hypothetical protein